jgi:hypothetical protein
MGIATYHGPILLDVRSQIASDDGNFRCLDARMQCGDLIYRFDTICEVGRDLVHDGELDARELQRLLDSQCTAAKY